jgi:hypothetical protein
MDAYVLFTDLRRRGLNLALEGDDRIVVSPSTLLTDEDRVAIRQSKPDLLRILSKSRETPDLPEGAVASPQKTDAATWRHSVTPNSRNPIVPSAIRGIIEGIEAEARAKGWPAELLWNADFWDSPRGLAAVLDEEDVIAEVGPDHIAILKTEHNVLRFQRRAS